MAKDLVNMSILFDLYGGALTPKQRDFFRLYYEEDLSLAEIAQNEGITRQGVRDAISHAESALRDMEEKLGLCRRFAEFRGAQTECINLAKQISDINRRKYFDSAIAEKTDGIRRIMESCE